MVSASHFIAVTRPSCNTTSDKFEGLGTSSQRSIVFYDAVRSATDQLRQRVAWALAQILTVVPINIDDSLDRTEIYVKFYDIFVKHAFGSYLDILREISYSPLVAEHLSYLNSKSHAYIYRTEEGRVTRADEVSPLLSVEYLLVLLYSDMAS